MAKGEKHTVYGIGTGNHFQSGKLKAEDFIEPLPSNPTDEQRKAYEDHVRRFEMRQEDVARLPSGSPLAGSDYRVHLKNVLSETGEVVKLPAGKSK